MRISSYEIILFTHDDVKSIDINYCENGSKYYVMRDTYCSFSLEFLFEVYAITNTEVNISVRAFN